MRGVRGRASAWAVARVRDASLSYRTPNWSRISSAVCAPSAAGSGASGGPPSAERHIARGGGSGDATMPQKPTRSIAPAAHGSPAASRAWRALCVRSASARAPPPAGAPSTGATTERAPTRLSIDTRYL